MSDVSSGVQVQGPFSSDSYILEGEGQCSRTICASSSLDGIPAVPDTSELVTSLLGIQINVYFQNEHPNFVKFFELLKLKVSVLPYSCIVVFLLH